MASRNVYHINKRVSSKGEHKVHRSRCSTGLSYKNGILLGIFFTKDQAVAYAKKMFGTKWKISGCKYCGSESKL